MAGRYNFPSWNYGYTLGPQGHTGDYTQYHNFYGHQGGYGPPGRGRGRGAAPAAAAEVKKEETTAAAAAATAAPTTAAVAVTSPAVIKAEPVVAAAVKAGSEEEFIGPVKPAGGDVKEEGEIEERSLQAILRGRNPVMFCNDQSKMRNMHMEWEQVSEIGPPHDKTFEYQLKMGEMVAKGIGKCKKDAKTKAAEDMVLKLDQLPKMFNKRPMGGPPGYGPPGGYPGGYQARGGYQGGWGFKRRRPESEEQILRQNDVTPKVANPAQDNPISKLFEFAKRKRWPEPLFDTIAENVVGSRRTPQGFVLKKTDFTMRCTVRQNPGQGEDKLFLGNAMTKKQAKHNAAAAAWAEIGGGVTQTAVDNLLTAQRKEATDAVAAIGQPPAAAPTAATATPEAAAPEPLPQQPPLPKDPPPAQGGKSQGPQAGGAGRGFNRYRYNRY